MAFNTTPGKLEVSVLATTTTVNFTFTLYNETFMDVEISRMVGGILTEPVPAIRNIDYNTVRTEHN